MAKRHRRSDRGSSSGRTLVCMGCDRGLGGCGSCPAEKLPATITRELGKGYVHQDPRCREAALRKFFAAREMEPAGDLPEEARNV